MNVTKILFNIDKDLKIKAVKLSKTEGLSISAWIRTLIIKELQTKNNN